MTQLTREELVEVLKLFDDPDYIPERIAEGFDAGRIKYLCTPTPSPDTVEAVAMAIQKDRRARKTLNTMTDSGLTTGELADAAVAIAAYEARRK